MIICQVEACFPPTMGMKEVEQELKLLDDVLEAIGGELIGAKVNMLDRRILAYTRTDSESGLMAEKIFESSYFSAERIACLGGYQEAMEGIEYYDRPVNEDVWLYPLAA